MNSLDRFSALIDQQAVATVGGNWRTNIVNIVTQQAAEHIDDIIRGFNAGNHRNRP